MSSEQRAVSSEQRAVSSEQCGLVVTTVQPATGVGAQWWRGSSVLD